jgi:phage protein D
MSAAVIPLHAAGQPFFMPAFEVKMRGAPLPRELVRDVVEVTYEDGLDKVDGFTLTLNNWDAERRTPKFLGLGGDPKLWDLVKPGNEVQLLMGYTGRQADLRVMTTGYITALDADFPEAGAPRVTVRGLNVLDRFRVKQYTWSWPAERAGTVNDSQIARDLARKPDTPPGRPGLGFDVRVDKQAAAREPRMPFVMMANQYPIVFLMQRARRVGYDLFIGRDPGDTKEYLYFGPSQRVADRTYKFEWGKSIVSVKPTISTARAARTVTVQGWDRERKQQLRGEATIADHGGDLAETVRTLAQQQGRDEVVTDQPVNTQREADQMAWDLLHKLANEVIQVTVVVVGLPDLRAGRRVELGRLGAQLDGMYFVTETTHTISDNGYRTTFKARREGAAR